MMRLTRSFWLLLLLTALLVAGVTRTSVAQIRAGLVNLTSMVTGVLPIANGGTASSTATGTGLAVLQTTPTLVTPNIGAATGTSLLVTGNVQTSTSTMIFGSTANGGSAHFGTINGNAYLGNTNAFGATMLVGDTAIAIRNATPFGWSSDATSFGTRDVLLVRDAAAVLALKNSANAQTLRVYGTTTGSKYLSLAHDGTNPIIGSSSGGLKADSTAITPASTGTRYLCIDTAGLITSSASACSGT